MKKLRIAIALFLTLSFAVSMFAVLPNVKGQIKAVPDRPTGAYISTNPDLIGINQELTVNLWIYPPPQGPNYEMGTTFPMYYHNITATFTRPDGSKDTFMPLDESSGPTLPIGPGTTEEVGTMWFLYKPNQLGTWSVSFSFPGETYTMLNYSVYYKPSTSQTITFTVQQDNVQIGLPPVQLPTGYWERPINAENREWSSISGDWLSQNSALGGFGGFNLYTTAPKSAHIVWKTSETSNPGGLVGGEWGGSSYTDGGATPFILNGRVHYSLATWEGTTTVCKDLRTGELIWQRPDSIVTYSYITIPSAQYTEFAGSPTAYTWSYSATAGWTQYNAWTGAMVRNITTNIPNLGTPTWESDSIAYVLRQGTWSATSLRRPFNFLIKWNLSKVTGNNWLTGVVWNVSLKQPDGTGPGEGSRATSSPVLWSDWNTGVLWTYGEDTFVLFDFNTGALQRHSVGFTVQVPSFSADQKLVAFDCADMMAHCFDLRTWKELWVTKVGTYPWGTQGGYPKTFAYDNWYAGSYDGHMRCVDMVTGNIKWDFYTGDTTETPYGTWAIRGTVVVADGKVYFTTTEHTPTMPRIRGNKLFCVDAYTGEGIWNVSQAGGGVVIADGYMLCSDEYDGLMYCFGKGKTETTVTAGPKDSVLGNKVVVEGSVLDLSPAQAGTAAVSDEDMSAWMEYLHKQKDIPMNAKGVEVSLDAVDPNNNFIHIGTATSTASGTYGFDFTPEVPGLYKIIATFAGSNSYWASYAETYVTVEEAHAVSPPAEQVVPDNTPIYTAIIAAAIAIIIAIAIAVVLILRKKP